MSIDKLNCSPLGIHCNVESIIIDCFIRVYSLIHTMNSKYEMKYRLVTVLLEYIPLE